MCFISLQKKRQITCTKPPLCSDGFWNHIQDANMYTKYRKCMSFPKAVAEGLLLWSQWKWLQCGSFNHKDVTFTPIRLWNDSFINVSYFRKKCVLLLSTLSAVFPEAVQGTCLRCFLGIWFGRGPPILPAGIWCSVQRRVTHNSCALLSLLAGFHCRIHIWEAKPCWIMIISFFCFSFTKCCGVRAKHVHSVLVFKNSSLKLCDV